MAQSEHWTSIDQKPDARPTLDAGIQDLIKRIEYELAEQTKRRDIAQVAITRGEAALMHLRRAADVANGKTVTHQRRALLNGRWSRSHEVCVECGTANSPHKAHGMCKACYSAKQRS